MLRHLAIHRKTIAIANSVDGSNGLMGTEISWRDYRVPAPDCSRIMAERGRLPGVVTGAMSPFTSVD
jgi:hypothetical protein